MSIQIASKNCSCAMHTDWHYNGINFVVSMGVYVRYTVRHRQQAAAPILDQCLKVLFFRISLSKL